MKFITELSWLSYYLHDHYYWTANTCAVVSPCWVRCWWVLHGPRPRDHWPLVSAPRGDHRARSRDHSPANGSATLGPAPPITAPLGSGQSPPSRRMWRGWRVESRGPSHYTGKCGYRKYFSKIHKYLLYLYYNQGLSILMWYKIYNWQIFNKQLNIFYI